MSFAGVKLDSRNYGNPGRNYRHLSVAPLTPIVGAEVAGVDLAKPIDPEALAEIRAALLDHCVIFFRDQDIDIERQKAFGRMFGELHIHPASKAPEGHPEILVVKGDAEVKYVAGNGWHTDVSADEEPPMGSILRLVEVPPSGGDTLFASMYAAYDALSDAMKRFVEGLVAVHSSEHVYYGRYGIDENKGNRKYPSARHPVVRTHPETGRKALYVNSGFTTHIEGLSKDESKAVLDFLYAHMARPEFQCRFRWEKNSIAFWDNRCTQHFAMWDYFPHRRLGYRVTVKGDRPYLAT